MTGERARLLVEYPGADELALIASVGDLGIPVTVEPHPPGRPGELPDRWAARLTVDGWKLVGVGVLPTNAVIALGQVLRRWLAEHSAPIGGRSESDPAATPDPFYPTGVDW